MPANDIITAAEVIRFRIKRGCLFRETFTWQDADGVAMDLDGAAFTMQARRTEDAATVEFEPTVATGETAGEVVISLTADETAELSGNYVADLQFTTGESDPQFIVRVEFEVLANTNSPAA